MNPDEEGEGRTVMKRVCDKTKCFFTKVSEVGKKVATKASEVGAKIKAKAPIIERTAKRAD